MQKIGAISKSPNHYQQLSTIAFAICVSIKYGIIDYLWQRYVKNSNIIQKKCTATELSTPPESKTAMFILFLLNHMTNK